MQLTDLEKEVRNADMVWRRWSVMDGSALRTRRDPQADLWGEECGLLLQALERAETIFIHCRGGLGRMGSLAAAGP